MTAFGVPHDGSGWTAQASKNLAQRCQTFATRVSEDGKAQGPSNMDSDEDTLWNQLAGCQGYTVRSEPE